MYNILRINSKIKVSVAQCESAKERINFVFLALARLSLCQLLLMRHGQIALHHPSLGQQLSSAQLLLLKRWTVELAHQLFLVPMNATAPSAARHILTLSRFEVVLAVIDELSHVKHPQSLIQ